MATRRSCRALLCAFILAIVPALAQKVEVAVLSRSKSPGQCEAPPATTTFRSTDAEVWMFATVSGGKQGDVMTFFWMRPDGNAHLIMPFAPLSKDGGFCFEYSMKVAGTDAVNYSGQWFAFGVWNTTNTLFMLPFALEVSGGGGGGGGGGTTTANLTVAGTANLYAYGQATPFNGTAPPVLRFAAGAGKTITFPAVIGKVSCCVGIAPEGPDGGAWGATNINPYRGISGIRHDTRQLFLAGVFLDDTDPSGTPPAAIDFTSLASQAVFSPALKQVFFIGDGLTGTGTGTRQTFNVPSGATRLYLGVADGWYVRGDPGYYQDNSGAYEVTAAIAGGGLTTCSYTLTPSSANVDAAGGTGAIEIATSSGCAWTAASSASWLTITSGASGSGNGTVRYTASANSTGTSRSATIAAGGKTFTLTQAAAGSTCTFSISPASAQLAAAGGTGSVAVTTTSGCAWTALSAAAWARITAGASGSGSGTVTFIVDANSSQTARSTTLTIAGKTFTINQSGQAPCSYIVNPASAEISAAGGTGAVAVTTQAGCAWTATTPAPWVRVIEGANGNGSGTVRYSAEANTMVMSRVATFVIADKMFTLTQTGVPANCTYTLTPASAQIPASGGAGSVAVGTAALCPWSATSSAAWARITEGASGSGAGTVRWTADAHTGTAARTASLTIAGRNFTLTQSGVAAGCTVTVLPSTIDLAATEDAGGALVITDAGCAWSATSNASWLRLSRTAGSGSAVLNYTLDRNTQAARSGVITIGGQTHTVRQGAPLAASAPAVSENGVANAADFTPAFAPGTLISVSGTALADAAEEAQSGPLPERLGGVSVEIRAGSRRWNAPLVRVAPNEVRAVLPFDVPEEVTLAVRNQRGVTAAYPLRLSRCAPRLFTRTGNGKGEARARLSDGRAVTEDSPAAANSVASVYVTGLGPVSPAISAAQPGGDDGPNGPRNAAVDNVELLLNGKPVETLFAGLAPGETALYRIDFKVPSIGGLDPASILVRAGGVDSQADVVLNAGPDFQPVAAATIGKEGGVVEGPGFNLTVAAGVFPRTANVQVTGSTAGQTAFSVAGIPSTARGTLAVSFEKPAGGTGVNGYVVVRDAEGGEMILKPSVQGNRLSIAVPMEESGAPAVSARTALAEGADIDTILLILFVEGLAVASENGHFEVYMPLQESGANVDALRTAMKRYADAFEVGEGGLAAKGVTLPEHFYPIPIRIVRRVIPNGGEYHGEICLSRYNGRQTIYTYERVQLEELEEAALAFRRVAAAHLLTHFAFNAYFRPSTLRTIESRDPWLWFEEAIATWLDREMGGGALGGPARLPLGGFMEFMMAMSGPVNLRPNQQFFDIMRNTAFPSPFGLAWPGTRSVAPDLKPTYARYYGQMASMFVDHIDAKLAGSHPNWLGELIEARRFNVGEMSLEPVQFLRDVFFPQVGLDLNVFWTDFCEAYSVAGMYADNGAESVDVLRSLLMLYGGEPGASVYDGLVKNGLRTGEMAMGDYGLAMFYIEEEKQRTKYGRVSVAVKSNTGAFAHVSACRTPPFCYFQVFPRADFREVRAMVADELRPVTWYPAMVIQPGSATPDRLRENVKFRVESDLTLSTARMARSRSFSCSLRATMECTSASNCTDAIALFSWLPEGSRMNCPGGLCLINYLPKEGESHLGYVQFKPGMIGELKFVSSMPFGGGKLVNGFTLKDLPITRLFGSAEEGDWEAATFSVIGPDIQKYVSAPHFKYTDRDGKTTELRSVTLNANSELSCKLDLIPMRVD